MHHLRRMAAAVLAAALLSFASAGPALAYPDASVSIDLGDGILVGGGSIAFSAASGDVDCAWTATYRGQQIATGSGTTFSGTVATPAVDKRTVTQLQVSCVYESDPAATDEVGAAALTTASAVGNIILLPEGGVAGVSEEIGDGSGSGDGSGVAGVSALLPDTGGQSFWYLVGGAALVVVGGGAFWAARRRSS